MGRNCFLGDGSRIKNAALDFARDLLHRLHDFHASAVVDGHIQDHAITLRGVFFAGSDLLA